MMMATCSGTGCARRASRSRASSWSGLTAAPSGARSAAMDGSIRLGGEDLLFLFLQQLVHLPDESIGRLLDLLVAAPLFILGDLLVLGHGLQLVVGLPSKIPNGHPPLFGHLADRLGELLAALFGQGG